ncbi:MAG: ATP-binding cassette domain-containing protein [Pseudomonadota bacterium]
MVAAVASAASLFPLRLDGVTITRRGKRLIGPIDLELGATGCTIVIGPNGAGKTTLLRAMHGLERISEGAVTWGAPEAEARRRQAFVFQRPVLLRRTVLENMAYPLLVHGMVRKAARTEAALWLERVGLGDAAQRPAEVLSGGERQKLALGRALIRKPDIVFLDEPCASLDGRSTREIEEILGDARSAGTRLVMSTHNMGQAERLADDVLFVHNGLVTETGPAQSFFAGPENAVAGAFIKGEIVE